MQLCIVFLNFSCARQGRCDCDFLKKKKQKTFFSWGGEGSQMKELFTWMFLFSVDYGVFGRRVIQALSQSEKKKSKC